MIHGESRTAFEALTYFGGVELMDFHLPNQIYIINWVKI